MEMKLDEAFAQICVLSEYAGELATDNLMKTELCKMKDQSLQWLGEILAAERIEALKNRIVKAGEEITGSKINDHGKFLSLVNAGWTKADVAEEFRTTIAEVEQYSKRTGIVFTPGRKSKRKPLENFAGDL